MEGVGRILLDSRGSNSRVIVYEMRCATGMSKHKALRSKFKVWNDAVLIEGREKVAPPSFYLRWQSITVEILEHCIVQSIIELKHLGN